MREILLARHGQAHCSVNGVIASDACGGLTDLGRWQAHRLGHRLRAEHDRGRPVLRIHASPVLRARQTAQAVAEHLDLEPIVEPALRVPDPGPQAEGYPWEELRRRWPPDPDRPSRPLIDGGESWWHFLHRTHACLRDLFHHHTTDGRILVIAHSEVITAAVALLSGHADLHRLTVDAHPAGITRLAAVTERPHVPLLAQRWHLSAHNDLAHLLDLVWPATDEDENPPLTGPGERTPR
ncbi:histidine phosphatase family protein [Amycolatopsis aidingensis]|uniref:histidine phosphatase family protein n=1 Tax=Amycolatopsis aidingensis TaxID=2842453 RepID=UPI001C0BFAC0|nr:histidine phosphatase family protein [Amycolatopsis aidingensis]